MMITLDMLAEGGGGGWGGGAQSVVSFSIPPSTVTLSSKVLE
jgi:hypothetical protein